MKRQWFGDWLPSWKEIRIPYRKFKLLNKFKEMNEKDAFFNFYVIRGDMEYAWRIKDYQFTPETVQEYTYLTQEDMNTSFTYPIRKLNWFN